MAHVVKAIELVEAGVQATLIVLSATRDISPGASHVTRLRHHNVLLCQ